MWNVGVGSLALVPVRVRVRVRECVASYSLVEPPVFGFYRVELSC